MTDTVNVLSRGKDGVDTKELKQLTRDFRGWKPDKQLHKMLRVAGELIAEDARALVEPHSKSTGGTIKVRVSKTRLSVVAGGEGHPISGLLELGNRGKTKSQAATRSGHFRHPVFGRWDVQRGPKSEASGKDPREQDMHPFLLPAAERNQKKIEVLEGKAVAEAFKEQGFPMEG